MSIVLSCHTFVMQRSTRHVQTQALTPGGTVSHHLMIHAPCPVLVLPYRALGLSESMPQRGDLSPDEIISPREPSGHIAEDTEGLSAARLRLAKMSATAPSAAGKPYSLAAASGTLMLWLLEHVCFPKCSGQSLSRLVFVAAMRRQDTPHPTQGLGSPEPEFSVENLKRQLSDKDIEISNLRVRTTTSSRIKASKAGKVCDCNCGSQIGPLAYSAKPVQEEVRQLKIVSDRERRKSIPEHQPA